MIRVLDPNVPLAPENAGPEKQTLARGYNSSDTSGGPEFLAREFAVQMRSLSLLRLKLLHFWFGFVPIGAWPQTASPQLFIKGTEPNLYRAPPSCLFESLCNSLTHKGVHHARCPPKLVISQADLLAIM
jgi:hypothetical protein